MNTVETYTHGRGRFFSTFWSDTSKYASASFPKFQVGKNICSNFVRRPFKRMPATHLPIGPGIGGGGVGVGAGG